MATSTETSRQLLFLCLKCPLTPQPQTFYSVLWEGDTANIVYSLVHMCYC